MKKYIHWIELNGYLKSEDEAREINQLLSYIEKYPDTEIEVYTKRSGWDTVLRIKCNQDFNSLDLDVNSFSSELRRKERKPSNIAKWMSFENWITSKTYLKGLLFNNYNELVNGM